MLIRYEILEEKFKFQKLKLTCLASDLFNSSMLEAELGLDQNMKVVENDVIYLPEKFQLNRSTVSCEMIEIPLTAKCPVLWTVFYLLGDCTF